MVMRKHELEAKLKDDLQLVRSGVLREDNPLDESPEFKELIEASRRGDLRKTQELISAGVNINGKDSFDYTPLIIASLCGHYEMVRFLLESGALAERDTFQGERCIYNALNDRIRNLLLEYDYSKSTDPLQPWAAHVSSLLTRESPQTSDINLIAASESFKLHKFLLSARSPYFRNKFTEAPETTEWKLPQTRPIESFRTVLRYLYLGDIPRDLVGPWSTSTEEEVLNGIDKLSKQLEIEQLWEAILAGSDRRLARQRHQDEVARAQAQVESFFREKVVGNKISVDTRKAQEVKWPHDNSIFADCLLRADEEGPEDTEDVEQQEQDRRANGIPIGLPNENSTEKRKPRKSVLYPVHKAMLIRSPYFETMFSSGFLEAQESEHLHIIKIDCTPAVLEIVLAFLYAENAECPLEHCLDLLYLSDMLLIEKLKNKAAVAITTLGSGNNNLLVDRTHTLNDKEGEVEVEPINVYDVIHAAWELKVQRLEEFAARYLAYRLEDYIDEEDFADLIKESASRLTRREETDTIELLDDIRYYLDERFRLRFEEAGLDEMLDESGEISAAAAEALADEAAEAAAGKDAPSDTSVPKLEVVEAAVEGTADKGIAATEGIADTAGALRTLDGEIVEDEFASDAINHQILLQKIDVMLDKLKLDA